MLYRNALDPVARETEQPGHVDLPNSRKLTFNLIDIYQRLHLNALGNQSGFEESAL
jgi:hypothetical protein